MKVTIGALQIRKVAIQELLNDNTCNSWCVKYVKEEQGAFKSSIENEKVLVEFENEFLNVKKVHNKEIGKAFEINEEVFSYDGDNTHSCIYLFKPILEAQRVSPAPNSKFYVSNGNLVKSIQVFGNNAGLKYERSVTLFADSPYPKINQA